MCSFFYSKEVRAMAAPPEWLRKGNTIALSKKEAEVRDILGFHPIRLKPDRADKFEGDGYRLATIVFVTGNGKTAFYKSSPLTYDNIVRLTKAERRLSPLELCIEKREGQLYEYESDSPWCWGVSVKLMDTGLSVSRYSPAKPEEYAAAEAALQEKKSAFAEKQRLIDSMEAEYGRIAASASFIEALEAIRLQEPGTLDSPSRVLWVSEDGTRRVYLQPGKPEVPEYQEYSRYQRESYEYSRGEKLVDIQTVEDWHKVGPIPSEINHAVQEALGLYQSALEASRASWAVWSRFEKEVLPGLYLEIPEVKYLLEKYPQQFSSAEMLVEYLERRRAE